jgi:hypothetical protein
VARLYRFLETEDESRKGDESRESRKFTDSLTKFMNHTRFAGSIVTIE